MTQRYDQLAGDVHDVLAQANDVEREKFTTISAAYSDAVAEINERLRRATSLVHKGLRDEAIQECEREPNLLDSFELLDIRDQTLWLSMHRLLKVPLPPPLLVQQAAELNSAYAIQVPLAELLRKHRLLALGHAPLVSRIAVLRQISGNDPNSEVWHTDIKAYETERIAEIRSELPKISQSRDLSAIRSLYRELNNELWIVPLPNEIKLRATEVLHELEIASARAKLNVCSANLLDAFAELDITRGLECRDEWELYLGPARLPPESPVLAETQPALDWLAEQEIQQQRDAEQLGLLSRLEAILDDDTSTRHELDATYNRLSTFDATISPVLTRRYRNRIQALQLKEHRVQTLKLVAIVGGLAIFAGAVFMGLRSYQFNARVREAAQQLEAHRQGREWQEGLSLLKVSREASPEIFAASVFQAAKQRFDENLKSDETRKSEFNRLVEAIRLGGVTIEDAPELSALKKLAVTPDEERLHAELERQKDHHDAEKEALDRERLTSIVGQLDADFRKLPQPNLAQLRSLLTRLRQARKDYPYALRGRNDSEQVSELDVSLERRIERRLSEVERDSRVAELLSSIHECLGKSMPAFAQKIDELQQVLANSEPGRQLGDTFKEKQAWLSLESIRLALLPMANRVHLASADQAKGVLAELSTVTSAHGGFPRTLVPLKEHMTAITRRRGLIVLGKLVPNPIRGEDEPHADLIKDLLVRYQAIIRQPTEWEQQFREILARLVSDQNVDPILKLKLLRVALKQSAQGSFACKRAFQPLLQRIESKEVETILREGADDQAVRFVSQLPYRGALRKHREIVKTLSEIPKSILWVGWLRPSGYGDGQDAGIQCDLVNGTPDGKLFVLVNEPSGSMDFQLLGSVRNSQSKITNDSLVQVGRPLYWGKTIDRALEGK